MASAAGSSPLMDPLKGASTSSSKMDPQTFQRLHPRAYMEKFLQEGYRPDGRQTPDWRELNINVGSITTADGSALARLGETTIVCGVKAEVAEPDAVRPGHGYVVSNLDLPAMCSPRFKPGPPGEEAQIFSERINELLVSFDVIPTSSLCIEHGKAVWVLYVDAVCINYDGNAFDATVIAILAALKHTRLPKPTWDEDNKRVTCSRSIRIPLDMARLPIPCSFGIFDSSHILADPSAFEEQLTDTLLTVTADEQGGATFIYQAGSSAVAQTGSVQVVYQCIQAARNRRTKIAQLLNAT